MVLPISINPTAAAQGACYWGEWTAIGFSLTCFQNWLSQDFQIIEKEREILKVMVAGAIKNWNQLF